MKVIGLALDWVCLVALLFLVAHAGVQFIRDVPVEPSWSWGFWAYAAGARQVMSDISKASRE